jgi:hypothetical protein
MSRRSVASALTEIDKRVDADGLLSDEDKEQIKAKAREHVAKKRKDKAEAELLAKEIRREEISYNPLEQFEDVIINLPPFVASQKFQASFISLDGKQYFHNQSYSVPYSVARVLEDIMARNWEHEREIHGERRKSDINRRPMNSRISPHNVDSVVNTRASVLNSNTSI